MDVTEFRPAYNVELYDAGVIITLGDGGGFSDLAIAGFEIDGDAVRRLMEHFGLVPQTARVLGVSGMRSVLRGICSSRAAKKKGGRQHVVLPQTQSG